MNIPANLSTHQHAIPEGMLAELRDSAEYVADTEGLQARMEEDGYLFLRGVLNIPDVLAARHEIFSRLGAVGEIAEPYDDAISTHTSRRGELVEDLGAFWQSLCEAPALRISSCLAVEYNPSAVALSFISFSMKTFAPTNSCFPNGVRVRFGGPVESFTGSLIRGI